MMLSLIFCTSGRSLYYTLLRRVNKTCSPEWNSPFVSFTHALLVVQASGFCLFKWKLSIEDLDQDNTSCQINVIYFPLSYFIFDTRWCVYMKRDSFLWSCIILLLWAFTLRVYIWSVMVMDVY